VTRDDARETCMSSEADFLPRVKAFVERAMVGMGLRLDTEIVEADDHVRIELSGDDPEPMLRRKGEALDALQHVVNSVFRHEVGDRRLVVDCDGFRRAKDREVRQMTRFLIDKARSSGVPQQIGPLNSYARRLVHLEVAEAGDVRSSSQGDGAAKIVVIARK
jgi:spoIIIJ-associated protein